MADSPGIVRFGCIRCKRTKRTERLDAAAERAVEAILIASYDTIHYEAQQLGIEVPPTLRDKMIKWARKQSIIPPVPPPPGPPTPPNSPTLAYRWD